MKIENKNESTDNCKLFNQAEKLKPKFVHTRTAINFYTGRLEEISASNNCTIKELISRTEKNYEDDFFQTFSLYLEKHNS